MAQERSIQTRQALIKAAFQLFGEKGFAATSTRELAAAAGTNVASIPYHFGSKAGLKMACADIIIEHMTRLRQEPSVQALPDIIQTAETTFEKLFLRQAYILLSLQEAEPMIRFLFREAHEQSDVFDHIYNTLFRPLLEFLLSHWVEAIGAEPHVAEEESTRITLFSIISQIAYFRIAQPIVARHLNWHGYNREEALAVLSVLQTNIRAIIAAHRSAS
ncbi:CerR family C-terminal domain-containing protein [Cohaesibacter intestini]|uniref:CerR family C-terminal domain-containing protein n=1 Tax=Cohaesibacter intestini TaxID=2211145 RepID=UPI000DE8F212|nr:CerR family C-terminal domain-containing protein [Cohaesibacter intestini]